MIHSSIPLTVEVTTDQQHQEKNTQMTQMWPNTSWLTALFMFIYYDLDNEVFGPAFRQYHYYYYYYSKFLKKAPDFRGLTPAYIL